MATETLILLGIGLYVVMMLAIGFYASRGAHSVTDFIVAGRNLPLWICSASIFATWFGTGIMMGAATSGYDRDMLMMVGEPFGSALALFLSGLFFARLYRRSRRLTWIELFEARYGRLAGVFAAVADIAASIIWLGGILFTFGVLLEALTGLPMAIGVFGGLTVIVIYTVAGGMWAVALTDFVQTIVLILGLFILLYVVLNDVGGWSAIAAQLPEHSMRLIPRVHTAGNWIDWIHVWMTLGIAAIASTPIIQRALSARTEAVAQNSFYVATVLYLFIGVIPIILGLVASVTMPDLEDPNAVLTKLAVEHLHPVLVVIFVGAILSSIMSTSDSVLLGVASVVSTNLLPLFRRRPDNGLRLSVARIAIPIAGLLATYVAFSASRVVQVLIDAAAPLLAGIIVPFVLCFWWEKANTYGALTGMGGGLLGWLIARTMDSTIPPDLIGFCVSLVGMVAVTLATQQINPPKPLTDADGHAVELKHRLGTLRAQAAGRRHQD
jgi:SSS family transporter